MKIFNTLIRIQAKIRGLIVRNKVKSISHNNKKLMPYHDPGAQFKPSTVSKIVRNINNRFNLFS
jgi:hypothetical protein